MSGPVAVLFDMDGLLVSTEETWFEVETEVMADLGSSWGPEHQEHLVGGPLEHSAGYLLALADRPDLTVAEISLALLDGMETRLREGPVRWMPGAERLLAEVADAGVPAGLVSSSYRRVMDAVLDAIGRDHFAVTVSADDVARTKPHPDPYLAAARALGVDPACCAALEDSATGATAARAAGCFTVVVPSVAAVPAGVADHQVGSLVDVDLTVLSGLMRTRACA